MFSKLRQLNDFFCLRNTGANIVNQLIMTKTMNNEIFTLQFTKHDVLDALTFEASFLQRLSFTNFNFKIIFVIKTSKKY